MTEAAPAAEAHHHHEPGFIRKYIFSTDHKMIGKQFLLVSLGMLVLGGLFALIVRWQLAWPGTAVPGLGWIPEPHVIQGIVSPAFYNTSFTMHATIMVFFVVMPILIGAFGNFLIPLMIGTKDMAFPVLNMLSFWVAVVASIIMLAGFVVPGGHASAGWTSYAPLSAVPAFTGVDWGQNLWIISLMVLGASSLMGSVNYITTVINMRAPGMTWMRLPLVIWSLFITAILLLLALPVLTAALGMLLMDRVAGTSFFLPAGGGQPILWQHLFWFFGHPEVYIMILPAMGIASDVLSTFSRKPIFGYKAMTYSIMAIAFLGWIVWGHHMFQSGMNPTLGTSFMISTMVIGVPSAIKVFNWLGTLWGGSIRFTTPMLFSLGFVSMFLIGGLSGVYMASTAVDLFIHDTYFIVAHIHYVLFGGSILAIFSGIYYWFPKMYGKMMNETMGKVHFLLTFAFFNGTFFPMHILGIGGHMRRIYNPEYYGFLQPLAFWNKFITISAICLGLSQLIFFANYYISLAKGRKAERNPWRANTLEWSAPTPPPHGNFEHVPTVYRGPYEYSSPEVEEDWLPQDRDLGTQAAPAH
jgi:cytochrome c oxidase subunit 1